MGVPRWRTSIAPARTDWPPKTFTPSRCAWESRPLREAAAPFLCAMAFLPYHRDHGSGSSAGGAGSAAGGVSAAVGVSAAAGSGTPEPLPPIDVILINE